MEGEKGLRELEGISALVPAFNEEKRISSTIMALRSLEEISEILVVDDGSHDNTARVACEAGARVFKLGRNSGKGEAVWRGALMARYPVLALTDADLGSSAYMMRKLVYHLQKGEADMVVAVFPPKRKGSGFGLVKKTARFGIETLTGKTFKEPLSGQRVFPASLLQNMPVPPKGFGLEIALTLQALKRGYRIIEVDVEMRHRELGRGIPGFWHRGVQLSSVGRELWRELWAKW